MKVQFDIIVEKYEKYFWLWTKRKKWKELPITIVMFVLS